ncbi:MAG: PIN domain-containing protein [Longimicrobiales bacterium]|nr:PIN domain-containing protein [Longimicrobiales bacterium]
MAYLFDTDAIAELLRPDPAPAYVDWLRAVPREEQFTSAVCLSEIYKSAYRSPYRDAHLTRIESRLLRAVIVLPLDAGVAREIGEFRASLEGRRLLMPEADMQVAATAIHHQLQLVTGNVRRFRGVPRLEIHPILWEARRKRR